MNKSCAILGCGWLGLPLGKHLAGKNWRVNGASTREDRLPQLTQTGINAFRIRMTPSSIEGDISSFLQAQTLILNTPPIRNENVLEDYPKAILHLITSLENAAIKNVLFIGSTSVYGKHQGSVSEETIPEPERDSGKALLKVESILRNESLRPDPPFRLSILRFGGLTGPGRKPGRFLSGKRDIPGGNEPVNLIHQHDCIAIIDRIIQKGFWGESFNACAGHHPRKKDFYPFAAREQGLPEPVFREENGFTGKRTISNLKLRQVLDYSFRYDDPYRMLE
jgi:nucleoside-diphosphate-sugar epimerase